MASRAFTIVFFSENGRAPVAEYIESLDERLQAKIAKERKVNRMDDLDRFLERKLQNPEFRKHWNSFEAEYDFIHSLLRARLDAGLTQKELSARAGIDQAVISRIESGRTHPNTATLVKIARGMGKKLSIRFE